MNQIFQGFDYKRNPDWCGVAAPNCSLSCMREEAGKVNSSLSCSNLKDLHLALDVPHKGKCGDRAHVCATTNVLKIKQVKRDPLLSKQSTFPPYCLTNCLQRKYSKGKRSTGKENWIISHNAGQITSCCSEIHTKDLYSTLLHIEKLTISSNHSMK